MENQIRIDLSRFKGKEIVFTIENGEAIIEGVDPKRNYPKKGYYVGGASNIEEIDSSAIEQIGEVGWKTEGHRNVYPLENHAILVGQVLGPILVNHHVLTNGYWNRRVDSIVAYSRADSLWYIYSGHGSDIGPLQFPFPSRELAEQFLRENGSELNKITQLWHNKQ